MHFVQINQGNRAEKQFCSLAFHVFLWFYLFVASLVVLLYANVDHYCSSYSSFPFYMLNCLSYIFILPSYFFYTFVFLILSPLCWPSKSHLLQWQRHEEKKKHTEREERRRRRSTKRPSLPRSKNIFLLWRSPSQFSPAL